MLRAVANAVGPVALFAEAVDVASSTLELLVRNGGHVVNAQLSARAEGGLGRGSTDKGGDESEGLHLDRLRRKLDSS